jgi:hypothetical protein
MQTSFQAVQLVEMVVPEQPIPIQHYLRQPQRLVKALVDPSRMEQLSADCFRLKLRPLSFMMFSVQPSVDLRVWAEANGTIRLQSIAAELRGIEAINQRFRLQLVGQLVPQTLSSVTYLQGKADLAVQVDLPPSLWFTPKSLIEATGNGLLRSILLTIKQRLTHQLLQDYCKWAAVQTESSETPAASTSFLPDSPIA